MSLRDLSVSRIQVTLIIVKVKIVRPWDFHSSVISFNLPTNICQVLPKSEYVQDLWPRSRTCVSSKREDSSGQIRKTPEGFFFSLRKCEILGKIISHVNGLYGEAQLKESFS